MQIKLKPIRMDQKVTYEVQGDIVIANGEEFDFSPLPEGASLPQEAILSNWFVGPVLRINGELHLSLLLPYGKDAPVTTRFPAPIEQMEDGIINLPLYEIEKEEEEITNA